MIVKKNMGRIHMFFIIAVLLVLHVLGYKKGEIIFSSSSKYAVSWSIMDSVAPLIQITEVIGNTLYEEFNITTKKFNILSEEEQIHISIKYPQLAWKKSYELQEHINAVIEQLALAPYNKLLRNFDITDGTQWDISYTVEYCTESLLSIKYEGHLYSINSCDKGIYWIYASNINLISGEMITTPDIFKDSFRNKIKPKYFKCIDIKGNDSENDNLNEVFSSYIDDFKTSSDNFYFTDNSFVIILPITDYYCFATEYDNLYDTVKKENPIWNKVLEESYDIR